MENRSGERFARDDADQAGSMGAMMGSGGGEER
jgi:hypothetical protein